MVSNITHYNYELVVPDGKPLMIIKIYNVLVVKNRVFYVWNPSRSRKQ